MKKILYLLLACGILFAQEPTRLLNGFETNFIRPYFNTGNLVVTATYIHTTTLDADYISGNGSGITNILTSNYSLTSNYTLNVSSNVVTKNYSSTVNISQINTTHLHAKDSQGIHIATNSGADVAMFGAGGSQAVTFYDGGTFTNHLAVNNASHGDAALEVKADSSSKILDGYDPSNNEVISFGKWGGMVIGTANNATISTNGFLTLTGSAVAWDDVAYQAIHPIKDTGVGSLTLTTITGNITGWAFQVNDFVPISAEFTHRWKIGTPVSIHCHAMTKSTNVADRFMKFQFEYCWVDINGAVTTPVTISNNFTVSANTPINTAFYVELGSVTPPVSLVSAHILGKLSRVAATGTEVASDPIILSFGVHGQIDSLGSRTEYVK